jgi:uncharacterized RDD family membrane protein YckC
MSDVSGGPGWWIASDQKWYPPESHPNYRPPPPPPPSFTNPASYPGGPAYPYPASPVAAGPALASYGQRLGGWLIDWVILLAVSVPISVLTHSFHYVHDAGSFNGSSFNNTSFDWGFPGALLAPLIIVLYGTLMCGSTRGQTVGMMATGTRAVKATTGTPIGYASALGRALFEELLAAVFFLPWILDMLFPLWDGKKQTLHDKVSGTIVVRVSRT